MAEGAERFRGLWEDEMFARQAPCCEKVCRVRESRLLHKPGERRPMLCRRLARATAPATFISRISLPAPSHA